MINVINDDWNEQKTYEAVYQKQQECTNEYPNAWLEDICALIKQLWDSVVIECDGVEVHKHNQKYIIPGFEIINMNNDPLHSKITARFENRIYKNNWNYSIVLSEHESDWLYTIISEIEGDKLPLTLLIDNNGKDAKCTYAFYLWDAKMPPPTLVVKYWSFLYKLEESFKKELEKRNQKVAAPLQNTTDELLNTIS